MEKTAYSSNNTLDFLFKTAKTVIDSFAKIDNYKPDNVPDEDLLRARNCFKERITQLFEQKNKLYSHHTNNNLSVINRLLELYQAEKELQNDFDNLFLMVAVDKLETQIINKCSYGNLKDALSNQVTSCKSGAH